LKAGKLPPELLARCLAKIPRRDPRVMLWPEVGEDAAAIEFDDRLLAAKTDPITFAADLIGWYAVHINANDIATCGAVSRWFMATVLLPEGADAELAESIFDQIMWGCGELGVSLVGGHIEVTPQVARPLIVGCMLGEAARGGLIRTGGAQVGDLIVVTKGVAIEGSAILAREGAADLRARGVSEETIAAAREFLFRPGISVVADAAALLRVGGVTAMHDPTEGGLAAGLAEMASAGRHGLRVNLKAIPVLRECREICAALGIKPLGLIASGALLAALAPAKASLAVEALAAQGISAAIIGEVRPHDEGLTLVGADEAQPLPRFERDELARYLDER
jgi:hydrogenase maturation factor